MSWTPEMDELLIQCRREGLSASRIAAVIGETYGICVTRSAVCGRAGRLKLPPMAPSRPTMAKTYIRRRRPKPDAPAAPTAGPSARIPSLPLPEDEPDDIPTLTFDELDLNDGRCRHRIDRELRGEPYGFCGKKAVVGLSCCPVHAKRWFANWPEVVSRAEAKANVSRELVTAGDPRAPP